MPNDRLPKQLLFCELQKLCPPGHLGPEDPVSMIRITWLSTLLYWQALQGYTRQAALERQEMPCTNLAHNELESIRLIVIINIMTMTITSYCISGAMHVAVATVV